MPLNPLAPVVDYQSMLHRICCFVSAAALGAIWLLRHHIERLDDTLGQIDFHWEVGSGDLLRVPGGFLLPALFVGLLTRIFRIHGRISSWLGIRERFEIDVILKELAIRSGIDVQQVPESQWIEHRHDTMREAFYRFVSSKSPHIDPHLIHQALDLWSWFWIGVESTLLYIFTGLVLIATANYAAGFITVAAAVGFASVGLPMIRDHCKRYAVAQVKTILSHPSRAAQVAAALSWTAPRAPDLRKSA